METNHSRRGAITAAVLALIDAAMTSTTAQAQTQAQGDGKTGSSDAVRTRTAKCMCGQLTVTYEGPDPERRSMCQCKNCQMRTGSVFSVQARLPRAKSKVEGQSTTWKFPNSKMKPVTFQSCDSGGGTYHFCPECGCTVFWDMDFAPDFIGIAVGCFTDPTFPPPVISGFEAYGAPWAMNAAAVKMVHADCGEPGKPCPPGAL